MLKAHKYCRTRVTSRIDYCNGLLAIAPSIWTDKLQRVLNAAARVITDTRKFDRGLTSILHDDLHWLDLLRRVLFKICVMVYISLHGMAPKYLVELCRPISDVQGRRHLRSAARGLQHTPRYYLSTDGRRAFSCAGPSAWNSLPERLRGSDLSLNSFRHSLKTFCSHRRHVQRIRDFLVIVGSTSLLFTFTFTFWPSFRRLSLAPVT